MKHFANNFYLPPFFILTFILIFLMVLTPGYAGAQDDIQTLRKQLEDQGRLIQDQKEELQIQQQKIDRQIQDQEKLRRQLEGMEKRFGGDAQSSVDQTQAAETLKKTVSTAGYERDGVGDLNSEAVQTGDFPGSFKIPGTGAVSLAIGGFVKTAAIYDTDAEAMGADFIPSTLGLKRPDEDGAFSLDATLTRINMDARAPARSGQLRGYVEYDLNNANDGSLGIKMRHAYGNWKNDYGTLTAGQTWSTMMDLQILPEGLTEPTVSGVIFMRQPIIRWSQSLGDGFTYHAAIEDPNSNDVFSDQPSLGNTNVPDGILGIEHDWGKTAHLRLNSIVRNIEVNLPGNGSDSATGWGTSLTGRLNFFDHDRIIFCGVYGEGLGRYLLGIQSTAGSAIDPATVELKLRENWGCMLSYQHYWTDTLRSTAMVGYAASEDFSWLPGDAFKNSTYASANLMWSVLPYLTMGVEYGYGQRENNDNSDIDNHRIAFGIQIY